MNRRFILFGLVFCILLGVFYYINDNSGKILKMNENTIDETGGGILSKVHPLSIEALRVGNYSGSDLVIEQTLSPGSNYQRYIVSYKSEGLKQFALLTVPNEEPPEGGYPAIVFNHGYIPPSEYRTTEKYIAYTDAFSRNGYVLIRPDYRGHGNSEGEARGGYGSNDYTIDVLNALASIKKYENVNPDKIGFWGHSMGGFITLRAMVVDPSIKVGVIWAGVVASYEDLFTRWHRRGEPSPSPEAILTPSNRGGGWRQSLSDKYGSPDENKSFWQSLSANSYLEDISSPVQLHHGTGDESVPYEFSEELAKDLEDEGKVVELYIYEGDDHNISNNFNISAQRSVEFFDKYLK